MYIILRRITGRMVTMYILNDSEKVPQVNVLFICLYVYFGCSGISFRHDALYAIVSKHLCIVHLHFDYTLTSMV